MKLIYCIINNQELLNFKSTNIHTNESHKNEGFIHCSTIEQLSKVANKRFLGQEKLYLLEINSEKLQSPIVYENTSGGKSLFPHVYGDINKTSVERIINFPCNDDGSFNLPLDF